MSEGRKAKTKGNLSVRRASAFATNNYSDTRGGGGGGGVKVNLLT